MILSEQMDERGKPTPINDRRGPELVAAVQAEQIEPGVFLRYRPVFGDLGEDARLREAFVAYRASLAERGVRETVAGVTDL